MGDVSYSTVDFDQLYKGPQWHDHLVRVPGVLRGVANIGDNRFLSMLGPQWLSALPILPYDSPKEYRDYVTQAKRSSFAVPVVGKTSSEKVLKRMLETSCNHEVVHLKGRYLVHDMGPGVLCLYQVETENGYLTNFVDDNLWHDVGVPILIAENPLLPGNRDDYRMREEGGEVYVRLPENFRA